MIPLDRGSSGALSCFDPASPLGEGGVDRNTP